MSARTPQQVAREERQVAWQTYLKRIRSASRVSYEEVENDAWAELAETLQAVAHKLRTALEPRKIAS